MQADRIADERAHFRVLVTADFQWISEPEAVPDAKKPAALRSMLAAAANATEAIMTRMSRLGGWCTAALLQCDRKRPRR
jgi:hypothetical protein